MPGVMHLVGVRLDQAEQLGTGLAAALTHRNIWLKHVEWRAAAVHRVLLELHSCT